MSIANIGGKSQWSEKGISVGSKEDEPHGEEDEIERAEKIMGWI